MAVELVLAVALVALAAFALMMLRPGAGEGADETWIFMYRCDGCGHFHQDKDMEFFWGWRGEAYWTYCRYCMTPWRAARCDTRCYTM